MAKDEKTGTKKSRRERARDKAKPQTKIIIRHLPPTMTEEEFLKQIDPLPEHDFYYYSAADWSLGFDATCRAYITFKNYDDVFLFRDRFDGYVFVDNKGQEYAAIVEFAPFQGFIKNKSRGSDNKVNTIEEESHYQQFLKKLEEEREADTKGGESKLEFSLDLKKEEITSTPLLQYLASKKEKRREDAKKRSAEKKRRREEEKDNKRKQNPPQTQPVKVLVAESNKADKIEQRNNQPREEPKNARARRREERNRLRHEAYLQKKKTSDDQKKGGTSQLASEKESNSQTKKEDDKQKIDKDTKTSTLNNSSDSPASPKEILKKSEPADELTESVRNFIFSAANALTTTNNEVQEQKEISKATSDKEDSHLETDTKSADDLSNIQEKLSKVDINSENQTSEEEKKPAKESRNQEERVKLTQKQLDEKREERRIRNKDRPSIAIYQPKARLRLSEESDSNTPSKDIVRSQSTSDCEGVKKDEQPRHKKVQRYSERSKNRKSYKEGDVEEADESKTTNND